MTRIILVSMLIPLFFFQVKSEGQTLSPYGRLVDITFNQKNKRPPGPYDLMAQMERIIPYMNPSYYQEESDCLLLTKKSATIVGSIIPDYGQPLESEPDGLYVKLYAHCMVQIIDKSLTFEAAMAIKNYNAILGDDLLKELAAAANVPLADVRLLGKKEWASLTPDLQHRISKRLIYYILGPDSLLRYYKYIGPKNVFGAPISSSDDLILFVNKKIGQKNSTPNFLYVFKAMVIMLRLGPALTN